jgi:hypothetical protein
MKLACETPDSFDVTLNGESVRFGQEYHLDPAFRVADISGAVRQGENEVILRADPVLNTLELEACFVLGDFAVRQNGRDFTVVAESELTVGNWVEQGYPFYAGAFTYRGAIDLPTLGDGASLHLRADDFDGVVARLLVDGDPVSILGWPPYEADLSSFAGRRVEIALEVYGSLRNLLGPLHDKNHRPGFAPPHGFDYTEWGFTEDYSFVPVGLRGPAQLIVRSAAS